MNRSQSLGNRKCRNLLVPSRVRRQGMAEKLDKQWSNLRRRVTIERDPRKLLELTAELEKRKQLAEGVRKHNEE